MTIEKHIEEETDEKNNRDNWKTKPKRNNEKPIWASVEL